MKINYRALVIMLMILISFLKPIFAQGLPSQQASGQEGLREQQERENKLRQNIEKPLPKVETQETIAQPGQPPVEGNQKALINKIIVTGNTILPASVIASIIHPFEGIELTVSDMQKVANLLTDAYRNKGYITTRVVLTPQQVAQNTLELKVIVGLMGSLDVRGNHYFKKNLFIRRVTMKEGDPFNYNKLRSDLYNINQYPDRNVKTTITPGQLSGESDVIFDVKDYEPIHLGFSYDNFGSKYVGESRFLGTVTDNNFLGLDDILTFQYQESEKDADKLEFVRYLLPVSNNTEIGFYSSRTQVDLQKDFKDLNARGKANIYGVFVNQTLVNRPDLKIVTSAGFDYKDVFNFIEGQEISRDRERVAKTSINVDYMDSFFGRNIFNDEIDVGIPEFLGGLDAVDPRASRVGSGGEFDKDLLDYLRLQSLPFDSTFLFKGEVQFASRTLTSTEEYQLGGISNVRGFAPGEAVGDSGQSFTGEFGLPIYGIPKEVPVPFSKAKLYDALRFAVFYDWGHVSLRDPQPGDVKDRILDSYGCGLRFTLPENFFIRLDFAWPVTGRPSDHEGEHTWLQLTKEF